MPTSEYDDDEFDFNNIPNIEPDDETIKEWAAADFDDRDEDSYERRMEDACDMVMTGRMFGFNVSVAKAAGRYCLDEEEVQRELDRLFPPRHTEVPDHPGPTTASSETTG